jgi:predicted GNAT family acetyltransferase
MLPDPIWLNQAKLAYQRTTLKPKVAGSIPARPTFPDVAQTPAVVASWALVSLSASDCAIMSLVQFELTRDVERFAAYAEDFLAERVERNVLATVLVLARSQQARKEGEHPLFACCLGGRGRVRAVAMRTPPWPLLACNVDETTAEPLLKLWLAEDPDVPGVSAQPAVARALSAAWRRCTGRASWCHMSEAMHLLSKVHQPPRPAPGRLRTAIAQECELLTEWERAFVAEAGTGVVEEAVRIVAQRLAVGAQHVWEDGAPVSTLALSPPIAGTVRVGPVYTPSEYRRRGYATSAVAAGCRRALASGAQRCMLFTDLANPTSNKIYATVGFRRCGMWEEHRFTPA